MTTKPIPDQYDRLIPSFIVRGAAQAIQFYQDVFGAQMQMRLDCPSGKIAHVELTIRGHVFMFGDEAPEMGMCAPPPDGPLPASSTMLYVDSVDATIEKALACGAKLIMPAADMFWGDRMGKFLDPFGHLWGVGTHIKEVSPEECAAAMAEWSKQAPPA